VSVVSYVFLYVDFGKILKKFWHLVFTQIENLCMERVISKHGEEVYFE